MGSDDRAERFCGVQPSQYVGQDTREIHVILWSWLWQREEVDVCPMTEPNVCALVCAKGEWIRDDSRILDCDSLEEGQGVITIVYDGVAVACFSLYLFVVFLFSALTPPLLSSLLYLSSLLVVSPSFAHSVMEQTKIFSRSPASNYLWRLYIWLSFSLQPNSSSLL